jgi:cytoskeletal protein RodZ
VKVRRDVIDPVSDPLLATHQDCIPELLKLGERLSQARLQKGLSQTDLAQRLHLGTDQLVALESGDRARLREPVFVIAQAKRVAEALGVDIHSEIDELRHSDLMQPPPRPHPRLAAPAPSPGEQRQRSVIRPHRARPGRSAWILAGVGSLALIAAVVGWDLRRGGPLTGGLGGLPAALSERFASAPGDQAGDGSPAPQPPSGSSPHQPTPSGAETAQQGSDRTVEASDGPLAGPSTASIPSADVLVLNSLEPSWLAVRDAEGRELFEGTLTGEKRFPLGQGLDVRAGRPDLVRAAVGDRPAAPLGPIDQIRWYSFKP